MTIEQPRNPPPTDWPRMSSGVYYRDAGAAIDWLCDAFGFEVRLRIENDAGRIEHSELEYGGGLVQVGEEGDAKDKRIWRHTMASPASHGGINTQCIMFFVDDVDAHCAHARAQGARIVDEPATHDYGADYWTDRSYGALDPEGHLWWVTQRIATGGTA